jgi:hypothetical protein
MNPEQIHALQARAVLKHPGPCYELRYDNDEAVTAGEAIPHYPTGQKAQAEAARYASGGWGTPTPHQCASACVTLRCTGCQYVLDEDELVTHFTDVAEAAAYARDGGWTLTNDGQALCSWCAPSPRLPAALAAGEETATSGRTAR